jgi:type III secretion protein W
MTKEVPSFESMAEHFLLLADDRYPSADKVLQVISQMNLPGLKEKIIVLSTMRDAVREMSPTRLYRSIQQRDELFTAIIEALENLEDELEELEEQAD